MLLIIYLFLILLVKNVVQLQFIYISCKNFDRLGNIMNALLVFVFFCLAYVFLVQLLVNIESVKFFFDFRALKVINHLNVKIF